MNIIERVEKISHVASERFVPKPSLPNDVKIELTSRCNLNCSFCGLKDSKREKGDMSNKHIKILLDAMEYLNVSNVGLFLLGESLLRDDLAEHVKYAKDIGIEYVYVTTNGVLCNSSKFDELREAGLDSLKISLNAGTKDSFKNVTGVDAFDKVMENIKYIMANKGNMNFAVSCVYDENYKTELKKIEDELFFIGCEFYFLPKYNQAGHVTAPIRGNVGTMKNPAPNVPCWELFNTMRFTWDGYMACCSFPHSDDFKIGHIGGVTIENLWKSDKFVKLREAHLKNKLKGTVCDRCINGKGD